MGKCARVLATWSYAWLTSRYPYRRSERPLRHWEGPTLIKTLCSQLRTFGGGGAINAKAEKVDSFVGQRFDLGIDTSNRTALAPAAEVFHIEVMVQELGSDSVKADELKERTGVDIQPISVQRSPLRRISAVSAHTSWRFYQSLSASSTLSSAK